MARFVNHSGCITALLRGPTLGPGSLSGELLDCSLNSKTLKELSALLVTHRRYLTTREH
jgi:hypothetical protein